MKQKKIHFENFYYFGQKTARRWRKGHEKLQQLTLREFK